jgi:hypothetical protein
MNTCPTCKAVANPLRLLSMTRRAPYRCGRCGGRSLLEPKHNTIAGLIVMGVVIVSALAILGFGFVTAIGCFLGLYVFLVGGIMWFFMRLRPVET